MNGKTIISNLIWKFSERIFAQLVSFVVSVVLARMLTPNDYGTVALVLVFITLADVFVTSGISTSLIQKKEADDTDFSTMFFCTIIFNIILYGILFFTSPLIANFYNNKSLTLIIRVFSLKLPLSSYNTIQHAYVSRNMMFKKFFFSTSLGTFISGIVGILLAIYGFGVWALIAQYFCNMIIDTIVLYFTIPWRLKLIFSFHRAKRLFNFGAKILFADLSGTFFGQLRTLIIGRYYNSANLAYYNKGQQIPSLITSNISSAVISVLFPAISNENDNIETVKKITQKTLTMFAFIIFPLLIGLIAIANPLILLLFTSKWYNSIIFTQILCVDAIIGLFSTLSLQTIKAVGRGDIIVKLEFIKKPMYILLLLIGVYYNVIAIAVTMVIYELYGAIFNMIQLKKVINYSIIEQVSDIFISLLSSIIMLFFLYYIKIANLWLCIILKLIIGLILYIMLSIVLKNKALDIIKDTIKTKKKMKGTHYV